MLVVSGACQSSFCHGPNRIAIGASNRADNRAVSELTDLAVRLTLRKMVGRRRSAWILIGSLAVCLGCGTSSRDSGRTGTAGDAGASLGGTAGNAGAGGRGGGAGNAVGGAGASGTGGAAGSSGLAGAAGASTPPMGGECAPSAFAERPFALTGGVTTSCGLDTNDEHRLPNPASLFVSSMALPTPTTAGQKFAFTLDAAASGPLNTEVWGADGVCGDAQELLWFAPFVSGTYCAEFTPSAAYSHVLLVTRPLASGNSLSGYQGISLCPGGACPNAPDGNGKQPGVPLTAPVGAYDAVGTGVSGTYRAYAMRLIPDGRLMLFYNGTPSQGQTVPLFGGVFRMTSADPFGDAWYCVGADSSLSRVGSAGDPIEYTFSLKNITRLGTCSAAQGSETCTVTLNTTELNTSAAESSLPELVVSGVSGSGTCRNTECSFGFYDLPKVAYFELLTSGDAGTYFEPTNMTVGVSEAAVIMQEDTTTPAMLACANSGSVLYDPTGTTTVSLDQMTAWRSCPGEPVENDTLEGAIRGL